MHKKCWVRQKKQLSTGSTETGRLYVMPFSLYILSFLSNIGYVSAQSTWKRSIYVPAKIFYTLPAAISVICECFPYNKRIKLLFVLLLLLSLLLPQSLMMALTSNHNICTQIHSETIQTNPNRIQNRRKKKLYPLIRTVIVPKPKVSTCTEKDRHR